LKLQTFAPSCHLNDAECAQSATKAWQITANFG
jgi:hypothetical protein